MLRGYKFPGRGRASRFDHILADIPATLPGSSNARVLGSTCNRKPIQSGLLHSIGCHA